MRRLLPAQTLVFLRAEEFSLRINSLGTRRIDAAMGAFDHVFRTALRGGAVVGAIEAALVVFEQKVDCEADTQQ